MKYFLHDTNAFADEKVTKVFMKYGYEGVGLFFCVLEKLAFQEKPIETKVLKKQLMIDKKLTPVWKFLIEIGLIEQNEGMVFNENVLKNTELYQKQKEKNKNRMAEWRASKRNEDDVTRDVTVTSRARNTSNKIKEKESKENDDDTSSSPVVENSAGETDDRRALQAETRLVQGGSTSSAAAVDNEVVRKDDNNINNNISLKDGVGIEELRTRAFKNVRFCLEFDAMGVPVEHLEGWLGAFNSWLEYIGETVKQERDYRAHFKSWLLKQPYKSADPRTYKPAQEQGVATKVQHEDADAVMRKRYG